MRILFYSSKPYVRTMFESLAENHDCEFVFVESQLDVHTSELAIDFDGICCFVDDDLSAAVLEKLAEQSIGLVVLRCTGFNNVDLEAADRLGIKVMRVTDYSPYSVAEFTLTLLLTINRKLHRAYNRIREGNFLLDGLLGFDLHSKTVGVVGTGKIGKTFIRLLSGFSCRILAYDAMPDEDCRSMGVEYTSLEVLLSQADIVSLHIPLTPDTFHIINQSTLALMKADAILLNTSRGAIINTKDLIQALKNRHLQAVGLDVYEEESHLYYRDLRDQLIDDDTFARLMTFPNVLVTGHQAFFTQQALDDIARTTMQNISDFAAGKENENTLHLTQHIAS